MRKTALALAALGATLVPLLMTAPAQAQATRTWVSGVGDDANPCSRTAPCKTFAGAISKTAAGGEINCVDPGGFGAVTIGKSITISCDYTEAGVLVSGTNGIIVNLPNATDIVTLKGLDLEGLGTGINGVSFIQNGVLHVHKLQIRNFRNGGSGINFAPTAANAELYVADSYITDNGNSSTTAGILVRPTGAGGARVTVNRTQLENNSIGVRVDGTASTGGIKALVRDSMIAGSPFNGVLSTATTSVTTLFLDGNSIFGNAAGVLSDGADSFVQMNNNVITGQTGIGMQFTNSGTLGTYVNNAVNFNSGGDGTTNSTLTPFK